MRRAGDEPNGLNEAMVVAALEHARELRMREVSLNFAGFAHVMAADAALSRSQRCSAPSAPAVHGRFQLERLVRFNDEVLPRAGGPATSSTRAARYLPLAALRVLQAEAYLPAPARHGGGGPSVELPVGSGGRPLPPRSASGSPPGPCW